MNMSDHFVLTIVLLASFLTVLVQGQNKSAGFISIDCGTSNSSYTDETTGISYVSDVNFTENGENKEITPAYKVQTDEKQFWSVRSFSQGIRNCYSLKPIQGKNNRYLIRARCMYGNYDNKNQIPTFDLYLGVNLWNTVVLNNAWTPLTEEIIHSPLSDSIYVCLVNTGSGTTPFISVLELRPLDNDTYQSETGSSLQLSDRIDFGSAAYQVMRFKDDIFDRLWSPFHADIGRPLNTSLKSVNNINKNSYEQPFTVISTAYSARNRSFMGLSWKPDNITSEFYFDMHFMELQVLKRKQYREFNISINGELWYGPFAPSYLNATTIYSVGSGITADRNGRIQILLNKTKNSTLPPLINAMEIYQLKELSRQETNEKEVDAMLNIKSVYGVTRNWQGDPCSPQAYSWEGLNCSYYGTNSPQITSLNLSSSGLKGEISPYIANLTFIQVLYFSNNNLHGNVPAFLAELSFLKFLNLKGNNLTGPVPDALLRRSNNGLSLRNAFSFEILSVSHKHTTIIIYQYNWSKRFFLFYYFICSIDDSVLGNSTSTTNQTSSSSRSSRTNKFAAPLVASFSVIICSKMYMLDQRMFPLAKLNYRASRSYFSSNKVLASKEMEKHYFLFAKFHGALALTVIFVHGQDQSGLISL
ncbi:hypothetical protein UlMin_018514 [Ulmus minor]